MAKVMHTCKCNICGAEFQTTNSRRRYCPEHQGKQQQWRNQQARLKTHDNLVGAKAKPGTKVCTGAVAKKCIYGSVCGGTYCCDYILITKKRRPCSSKACDQFTTGERPKPNAYGRVVFK